MANPTKLGIIAGGGALPRRLADACRAAGRPVFILAFPGQTDAETVDGVPHLWSRFGAAGEWLGRFHAEGVRDLCLIGKVHRPSLREIMPDWKAARFLARHAFTRLGDDALLRAIGASLQEEGFRLVGIQDVLDGLLARPGTLTRHRPDEVAEADIALGLRVALAIGSLDIGQGCVVQQGLVLAVEAAEGTDAMLDRCAGLRRDGPGGVLVKASKPQQDRRLDLPTAGVATVERAAAAGLRGIALQAGGTLIVDPAAVAEAADRMGLFVVAVGQDATG